RVWLRARAWASCSSFFFSSRRRHTRCYRDWSSDVCSSDLLSLIHPPSAAAAASAPFVSSITAAMINARATGAAVAHRRIDNADRSEERRVGKEGRGRGGGGRQRRNSGERGRHVRQG